jgi:hypothetical protein
VGAHRIVYLSWPAQEVTGGIKMVFRHVEGLCAADLPACVATVDARRPDWFRTTAPLVRLNELRLGTDILVFPENNHTMLRDFTTWKNPKVVFCQNQFMAYRGVGGRRDYSDYGVHDVICPGQETASFCRRRFPGQRLHIVRYPIDPALFFPRKPKVVQVAYMPRKRSMEASFIQDLFRSDNPAFRSVPWVEVAGMDESEVARVLGESAVYLSLCRFEAVSLSALEALASGCIVAGFTGFGGRDYATSRNGFWAGEDDAIQCTEHLSKAVQVATEMGDRYHDMVESATLTSGCFGPERFQSELVLCWTGLLDRFNG